MEFLENLPERERSVLGNHRLARRFQTIVSLGGITDSYAPKSIAHLAGFYFIITGFPARTNPVFITIYTTVWRRNGVYYEKCGILWIGEYGFAGGVKPC